jgi:hypothetical protein
MQEGSASVEASRAVSPVQQPPSAGKLTNLRSPRPWGVAISKLTSFFPAVSPVQQPPSAGKLTDRGSPPPRGVAISKLTSFFPAVNPVQQPPSAGKLTDRCSPRPRGVAISKLTSSHARCVALSILLALLAFSALNSTPALAEGDANHEACANEGLTGFASFLADCRAFELATPAFKAGGEPEPLAISADGSRFVSEAVSVTGGVNGDGFRAYYESSRSGSGWATGAINPASGEFPAQELWFESSDLSGTLWDTRHSSESVFAQDLYVREAGGSMVEVGPMIPPSVEGPPAGEYQFFIPEPEERVGASADLSHVFFQLRGNGFLWPGDTTQPISAARSLYEYVGRGNTQPTLVGVNGEGNLISNCSTVLGSIGPPAAPSADVYNAVSADGETVFFTAAGHSGGSACEGSVLAPVVNEVFARVGGGPVVSVSEPSVGACAVCQTGVGVQQPAEFAGASADGSKVFFLTSQELLKGAVGENLYEYDFSAAAGEKISRVSAGVVEPAVESKVLGISRVSEDGSHVYFVAAGVLTGANREGKAPVEGGDNLYVFERDAAHPTGHLAFIGALAGGDAQDWSPEDERLVQATPDGEFLVFVSEADLTVDDTSTVSQVFEYNAGSEELVRVSVGEPGYGEGEASANEHSSRITIQNFTHIAEPVAAATKLAVSGDGSVVMFSSKGGLTVGTKATGEAGVRSVYEYRSSGGVVGSGRVFQVSDGRNVLDAKLLGLDGSGGDLFFKTTDALVPGDVDSQLDVYDARVGGGFPVPPPSKECESENSCQGPPSPAPPIALSGGVSQPGGNVSSPSPPVPVPVVVKPKPKPKPVKCKKGFVKKKNRCVKVKRARSKKPVRRGK